MANLVFHIGVLILLIESGQCDPGERVTLLDDEAYDLLVRAVEEGTTVPFSKSDKIRRKVHDIQRRFNGQLSVTMILNPVTAKIEKRLCLRQDGGNLIYPRLSEAQEIIQHFYRAYKQEGARKLWYRIGNSFVGISRTTIQTWLNNNKEHTQRHPEFSNQPPPHPVVSHTPNKHHQIDLVVFESNPQVQDGIVYKYVLSVLDVFSRYLWLRPTATKEPEEVSRLLLEIYR